MTFTTRSYDGGGYDKPEYDEPNPGKCETCEKDVYYRYRYLSPKAPLNCATCNINLRGAVECRGRFQVFGELP